MNQVVKQCKDTSQCKTNAKALEAYSTVTSIGSSRGSKVSVLGIVLMGWLPVTVRDMVAKWADESLFEFPALGTWVFL